MTKYYLTKSVARQVVVDGNVIPFEAAEFFQPTGSFWGTFSTEDTDLISKLEALVKTGAIDEISEEDYELFEVKKKRQLNYSNCVNLNVSTPKPAVTPYRGLPAEVVETPAKISTDPIEEIITPQPVAKVSKKK